MPNHRNSNGELVPVALECGLTDSPRLIEAVHKDITAFLADTKKLFMVQSGPESPVQRAEALMEQMALALFDLHEKIRVEQRGLWMQGQVKIACEDIAALQALVAKISGRE
ncbi:hypothetical protein ACJBU6_06702 [Exserohilum turcicum]